MKALILTVLTLSLVLVGYLQVQSMSMDEKMEKEGYGKYLVLFNREQ